MSKGGISHPKMIKSCEIISDNNDRITLICNCGEVYDYIPKECRKCGHIFVKNNDSQGV